MVRVNDWQVAHPTMKPNDRNWIRGTWYTGVMAVYKATGDEKFLKRALEWGQQHQWQVGTERAGANHGGDAVDGGDRGGAISIRQFRAKEQGALSSAWSRVLASGMSGGAIQAMYAGLMKDADLIARGKKRPRKTAGKLLLGLLLRRSGLGRKGAR
jgi:hypothetical protein